MNHDYITPNWPAPTIIKAYTTTRRLNLLDKEKNGLQLCQELNLPKMPCWLKQIHSDRIIEITENTEPHLSADASFTREKGQVCAVLTADCLPILICHQEARCVSAIHAGWRGLHTNIITKTISAFKTPAHEFMAWLGPAISGACYEVGNEVYDAFVKLSNEFATAFIQQGDKWLLDIYQIATLQLQHAGIQQIYTDHFCTYRQIDLFYSYRREGQASGRMATLIWITPS